MADISGSIDRLMISILNRSLNLHAHSAVTSRTAPTTLITARLNARSGVLAEGATPSDAG